MVALCTRRRSHLSPGGSRPWQPHLEFRLAAKTFPWRLTLHVRPCASRKAGRGGGSQPEVRWKVDLFQAAAFEHGACCCLWRLRTLRASGPGYSQCADVGVRCCIHAPRGAAGARFKSKRIWCPGELSLVLKLFPAIWVFAWNRARLQERERPIYRHGRRKGFSLRGRENRRAPFLRGSDTRAPEGGSACGRAAAMKSVSWNCSLETSSSRTPVLLCLLQGGKGLPVYLAGLSSHSQPHKGLGSCVAFRVALSTVVFNHGCGGRGFASPDDLLAQHKPSGRVASPSGRDLGLGGIFWAVPCFTVLPFHRLWVGWLVGRGGEKAREHISAV